MEEVIIKESEADYFKSATVVLKGYLVMTNKRIFYYGEQSRLKLNHGKVGNIIRDKMESAMGYDQVEEEHIFDIPIQEVSHGMKRFGLSKRLVISDQNDNEYKLTIYNKAERNSWPEEIDKAKSN